MIEAIILFLNAKLALLEMFTRMHGLCEQVHKQEEDGEQIFPAEYCSGEMENIDWDYEKALSYWRLTDKVSDGESDAGITGCNIGKERTYSLRLAGMVPKDIFKTNNAYIDDKIVNNVIKAVSIQYNKQLCQLLKAVSATVSVKNYTTDRESIINDEYKGVDIDIPFEKVIFAIDFEAKVTGDLTRCFEYWACNDEQISVIIPTNCPECPECEECPVITEIDGGDETGTFAAINGTLDGGGA